MKELTVQWNALSLPQHFEGMTGLFFESLSRRVDSQGSSAPPSAQLNCVQLIQLIFEAEDSKQKKNFITLSKSYLFFEGRFCLLRDNIQINKIHLFEGSSSMILSLFKVRTHSLQNSGVPPAPSET